MHSVAWNVASNWFGTNTSGGLRLKVQAEPWSGHTSLLMSASAEKTPGLQPGNIYQLGVGAPGTVMADPSTPPPPPPLSTSSLISSLQVQYVPPHPHPPVHTGQLELFKWKMWLWSSIEWNKASWTLRGFDLMTAGGGTAPFPVLVLVLIPACCFFVFFYLRLTNWELS